jgi:hypothetical protein
MSLVCNGCGPRPSANVARDSKQTQAERVAEMALQIAKMRRWKEFSLEYRVGEEGERYIRASGLPPVPDDDLLILIEKNGEVTYIPSP